MTCYAICIWFTWQDLNTLGKRTFMVTIRLHHCIHFIISLTLCYRFVSINLDFWPVDQVFHLLCSFLRGLPFLVQHAGIPVVLKCIIIVSGDRMIAHSILKWEENSQLGQIGIPCNSCLHIWRVIYNFSSPFLVQVLDATIRYIHLSFLHVSTVLS